MKLECYAIEVDPPPLIPARPDRAWMDAYPARHAYRCLPLAIANTYGWELVCPANLSIQWNGGPSISDIRIDCVDEFGSPSRKLSKRIFRAASSLSKRATSFAPIPAGACW